MTTLLAVSLLALLLWLLATLALFFGMRRIQRLDRVPAAADADCPSLSVIVPACNEAATIEPALRSLLALDYPRLELIVVDDRSEDGTGAIIRQLAATDSRLCPLRVDQLAPGWLGKNHALNFGSQTAAGEWLLFTDADVVYERDALRRVMAWVKQSRSDHVVALPRVVVKGFWERLFVTYFMVIFNTRYRPWKVADPNSSAYMGVGAFNLVRAQPYRALGGHAALPLEVADDMKLGKRMKAHGARSTVVDASDGISVRWVVGLPGIVEGLTKNTFAGLEFRLGSVAMTLLALPLVHIYPAFGLFAGGAVTVLCGLTLACMACAAAIMAPPGDGAFRRSGVQESTKDTKGHEGSRQVPGSLLVLPCSSFFVFLRVLRGSCFPRPASRLASGVWGLAFPLAALVMLYIVIRSTWLTYRRGGVLWRGTLYPLEELRRGVV
jgi:hypothetical protein